MEYRIAKDDVTPPIYWIEKLADGEWVRVFGTTAFDAGIAWDNLNKQEVASANVEAILTPQERKMVLDRRFAFCGDLERTVWTEAERVARLQLVVSHD
jgi:hypothetical protein